MKKFSIIVPVYNTKPHLLSRCIDSIINNEKFDKENMEIILIDDGSDSIDTTNWIKKNIDKFIFYKLDINSGSAVAKNLGIMKATSKYILFIDSDDYILDDYFNYVTDTIKSKKDFYVFQKNNHIDWSTWAVIIRNEFIKDNNITYLNDINKINTKFDIKNYFNYAEDFSFLYKIMLISDNWELIGSIDDFYYYNLEESINSKICKNNKLLKTYFLLFHIHWNIIDLLKKDENLTLINKNIKTIFSRRKIFLFNWKNRIRKISNDDFITQFLYNKKIVKPVHGIISWLFIKKLLFLPINICKMIILTK